MSGTRRERDFFFIIPPIWLVHVMNLMAERLEMESVSKVS